MSLVVAMTDIHPDKVNKVQPGKVAVATTPFFKSTRDTPNAPAAYRVQYDPGRVSKAHYHVNDQFQVIVDGKGQFGRHEVSPYYVHFSRAYTPYGPLTADKETGWAFLTLRTRYDPGSQRPLDKLKTIPDRRPWQVTKKVTFPAAGAGVKLHDIAEIKDDQGLFAYSVSMDPGTHTATPDPAGGDGQFVVVLKGSLIYGNKEFQAMTVVFVKPDEGSFQLQSGVQGLEGLILNFPKVVLRQADTYKPSIATGFRKWQCTLCAFSYDEAVGMPEDGIPAGTRWQDVPDTWSCPDCSATKSDFDMIEV